MNLHLFSALKLATANWAYVHDCLCLHLALPLFGQQLSLSSSALLLIELFWSWLILFELLLSFFLQLFHCNGRSCLLLLDFPLFLPMIVIIFLLRPFLHSLLSLSSLIWQRLQVVIVGLVSGVEDSHFLSCYSKARVIGLSIGLSSLFWREELYKSEVFKLSCNFIANLPYISDRNNGFKSLKKKILLHLCQYWPSDHQTTILGRFLTEWTLCRLCTIAQLAT